jgi:hypothetical protein
VFEAPQSNRDTSRQLIRFSVFMPTPHN